MTAPNYQNVSDECLDKINDLNHEQMLLVGQWIIKHIVKNTPNDFADEELDAQKPLFVQLKSQLVLDDWNVDAINGILQKLQDISDELNDDSADMNMLPLTLWVLAEHYTDMDYLYHCNTKMLTGDMIANICADVFISYLDYLDYAQDDNYPDIAIDDDKWGEYLIIQDGIQKLYAQINELKNQ